jgi:hypothetical protein
MHLVVSIRKYLEDMNQAPPFFTTFTMKALVSGIRVFGSPVEGVKRFAASPPPFG